MNHDRYTIFAIIISAITFVYMFALILFVMDLKDAMKDNKATLDRIEGVNSKYEHLIDKRIKDIEDTDVQIFLENYKLKRYDLIKLEV